MLSKYTIFFVFILFTQKMMLAQNAAPKHKLRTVVIDAGHGGKDPGAIGKISKEKELTLAVALELGKKIREELKDVKVIFTRDDDRFIELFERADIANRNKADMFISIHINSSKSREARGAEAWVLGLHKSDENLELAKRENEVIQLEGNVEKNYGFDPNSPAGNIMMTMQQSAFLNHSILFAKKVESEFAEKMNRKNRGVHQAGFVVLYKTVMPSCLIELGFISNREEEQYLNSDHGREEIASSIFTAFRNFKAEYEGTSYKKENRETPEDENEDEKKNNLKTPLREVKESTTGTTGRQGLTVENRSDNKSQSIEEKQAGRNPAKENLRIEKSGSDVKSKKTEESNLEIIEEDKWNASYIKIEERKREAHEMEAAENKKNVIRSQNLKVYRVQIMARPEAVISSHPVFGLYNDVEEIKEDNVYKYVCGKFENIDDALIRKVDLKKKGYPDAFIAVYEGNKRVGYKF